MKKPTIYVTKAGYKQYIEQLQAKEKALIEHMKTRPEYGMNASDDYRTGVFDAQRNALMYDIKELKAQIDRLEVIKEDSSDKTIVNIDDIVTIQFEDEKEIERVQIVGGMPDIFREDGLICISMNSPMGKAIYKKKIGETVSYNVADSKKMTLTILSKEKDASEKEITPEV